MFAILPPLLYRQKPSVTCRNGQCDLLQLFSTAVAIDVSKVTVPITGHTQATQADNAVKAM
jgi:hypothetical protein